MTAGTGGGADPSRTSASGAGPPPHLLHAFATFTAAGPQVRTARLMAALGGEFRHSVVAMDGRMDALDLVPEGVEVRGLPSPPREGRGRALLGLLRCERPDLVLTYNWGSLDAVIATRRLGRVPLIHHEEGFNADEARRLKLRRNLARAFFLRGAHRVVVVSRGLETIARRRWYLPASRVQLMANGVDTEVFRPVDGPSPLRAELGIPPDALVVGAVGHLRPIKRFDRLIEACAAVPGDSLGGRPLHLVLVGDGAEREALATLAGAKRPPGGSVHLVGHRTDLAPWYGLLDLLAISSDSEQLPMSLLEGMATGLSVVATDVGDVGEVLPPGQRSELVPVGPGAAGGLARRLGALLADRAERGRRGRVHRERVVELYGEGAMVRRYRDLYLGALAPS